MVVEVSVAAEYPVLSLMVDVISDAVSPTSSSSEIFFYIMFHYNYVTMIKKLIVTTTEESQLLMIIVENSLWHSCCYLFEVLL